MKHKLFFTTCAIAAIVAPISTANAASNPFTDINGFAKETQQHILNLVDQKIINGKTATTFAPSEAITRGQVVKMLGRFLVNNEITPVPADWESKQYFSDISLQTKDRELLKYAAVVKSAGVFNGKSDGTLDASGTISRENMALVLDRATEAMRGKSLVEIAYVKEDNLTDLYDAKEEAQEAIRALNALGISNVEEFNPKGTVKRVHFATFLSKAIEFMDPEYTVSEFTIDASDYGFSRFDHVTNLDEASFDVEFTSTEITVSGEFAEDEIDSFMDWVDVEGTDLFGHPHFASIDFELDKNSKLKPSSEFDNEAEAIPAKAFLMDSFTSVTASSTTSDPKTSNFTNNGATYSITKDTPVNEIVKLNLKGYTKSENGTDNTIVNDTVQYYVDYAGNIVLDQTANNYTYDYRYYITQSGEVLKNGEPLKDTNLFYLPARSNYDWDVAAFQSDATLDEILAFHKTDGTKDNFDFSKTNQILVIDDHKNVYGILDLSGYNEFFKEYSFELNTPFKLNNSEITAYGDLQVEKVNDTTIKATALGFDALDSLVVIEDEVGNTYFYEISKTSKGYKLVEVEDEFLY